jgi:SAM-dependent methyltransferase
MAQLACTDDTFDGVLCASALDLLPDPVDGLRKWWRVLKPQGTVAFYNYARLAFQPLQHLFETRVRYYAVGLSTSSDQARPPINELELASDLLRNAEEWWAILCHSTARLRLEQLAPDALARFKTEHLAAVAELATVRGIWLNVAAIFAVGQKSNQTVYYASLTRLC